MNRLGKPVASWRSRTGSVSHSDLAGSESNDAARINQNGGRPQGRAAPMRHRFYEPGDRRLVQAEALAAIPSLLASLLDSLCEFRHGDVEIQIQKFARTAEKLAALAAAEPEGSA
jgi:hypothetical protein